MHIDLPKPLRSGFASFRTVWRTLRGYEIMNMIRKGQLQGTAKGDVLAHNHLVAEAFGIGA
jgi:hypothetical protein